MKQSISLFKALTFFFFLFFWGGGYVSSVTYSGIQEGGASIYIKVSKTSIRHILYSNDRSKVLTKAVHSLAPPQPVLSTR